MKNVFIFVTNISFQCMNLFFCVQINVVIRRPLDYADQSLTVLTRLFKACLFFPQLRPYLLQESISYETWVSKKRH